MCSGKASSFGYGGRFWWRQRHEEGVMGSMVKRDRERKMMVACGGAFEVMVVTFVKEVG